MPTDHSAFNDRTVSLQGAGVELARVAEVLASPTRVAVLETLRTSREPLHINEIARRVGVDASPVRTHLELLVKTGLAEEVDAGASRLRKFTTRLTNVHVTLEGVNRAGPAKPPARKPREVTRLERKLAEYGKRMDVLREKAARVQREMREAWKQADDA